MLCFHNILYYENHNKNMLCQIGNTFKQKRKQWLAVKIHIQGTHN